MRPDPPVGVAGVNIADPQSWPPRMLTSEVLKALRVSMRTFRRRCDDGTYDLKPVDRGREQLYLRIDVMRVLGLADEGHPKSAPTHAAPRVDHQAIKAALAAPRRRPPRLASPRPAPEPMAPDRQRAFLLNLHPGVRVWLEEDGRYSVSFVARRNVRASSWPPVVPLPRDRPGPITLATQSEYEALVAEAAAVRAECKAARLAELNQESPKAAR